MLRIVQIDEKGNVKPLTKKEQEKREKTGTENTGVSLAETTKSPVINKPKGLRPAKTETKEKADGAKTK